MTKIAIDISQTAFAGTGVARYTTNLVRILTRFDKKNRYTFFYSSLRKTISPNLASLITPPHTLKLFPFPPAAWELFHNMAHLPFLDMLIGNHDILISSDWTQPSTKAKKISIVHDLVYLKYPQTLHPKIIAVQKRRMELVKKECELIIADSLSTKLDLIELLGIDESRIKVIYPSVTIQKPTQEDIKHTLAKYAVLNKKYALTVGKLEPRKNIARLISAFQKANINNISLLIVGPKGWDTTSHNLAYIIPDTVHFLGYVPDADLYALYAGAQFFIYPSLYEGFGYPVVEAMSVGCPVATSNTSSMKEIANQSALLFDPQNESEIGNAMAKLASSKEDRNYFSKKGAVRALDFSEQQFYEQFMRTIEI